MSESNKKNSGPGPGHPVDSSPDETIGERSKSQSPQPAEFSEEAPALAAMGQSYFASTLDDIAVMLTYARNAGILIPKETGELIDKMFTRLGRQDS